MIIELFGLPGVGKSTYARTVASEFGYTTISLRNKRTVMGWCMVAMMRFPAPFFRHLVWCLRHNPRPFYVWNFFCVRIAKYTKASVAAGSVILDEGPLQNILSFPNTKLTEENIQRFLKTIPKAGEVIILTATDAERRQRLRKRPYQSWRQHHDVVVDYDSIMRHNHDLLVAAVSDQPSFRVVDHT